MKQIFLDYPADNIKSGQDGPTTLSFVMAIPEVDLKTTLLLLYCVLLIPTTLNIQLDCNKINTGTLKNPSDRRYPLSNNTINDGLRRNSFTGSLIHRDIGFKKYYIASTPSF